MAERSIEVYDFNTKQMRSVEPELVIPLSERPFIAWADEYASLYVLIKGILDSSEYKQARETGKDVRFASIGKPMQSGHEIYYPVALFGED